MCELLQIAPYKLDVRMTMLRPACFRAFLNSTGSSRGDSTAYKRVSIFVSQTVSCKVVAVLRISTIWFLTFV